jgi:septum formation protein
MTPLRPLCLASASPRRLELLQRFGLTCTVCPAHVDERAVPGEAAETHVARLAREKAEAVRGRCPGALIVAADTVVELDGRILGKPCGKGEGEAMLRALSGRTHRVLSGYHALDNASGAWLARTVETAVTFRELPADWIAWYCAQPEMLDKAGAYGIQGLGGMMVTRIEGSYTNVMGFPVEFFLWDMLERGWIRL